MIQSTTNTLEHPFNFVKSSPNLSAGNNSRLMIHHKDTLLPNKIIVSYRSIKRDNRYGVSSAYRVLSPQLLFKKFDYVRECLANTLGLTVAQ